MAHDEIDKYLAQPYSRLVIPEPDGTFRGEILEFPGCIAIGETAAETLGVLEEVARDWLLAALGNGQNIPEPVDSNDFSGRLVLRLPRSLHKKAARLAEREGVSLNQFIMAGLAEYVGERTSSQHTITLNTVHPGVFLSYQNVAGLNLQGITMGQALYTGTLRPWQAAFVPWPDLARQSG